VKQHIEKSATFLYTIRFNFLRLVQTYLCYINGRIYRVYWLVGDPSC